MAELAKPQTPSLGRVASWIILLTMGITWGLSFSLARIATVAGTHPLGVLFWETWIAGILLLVLVSIGRRHYRPSRSLAVLHLATGLLGTVIPGAGFFYAAPHVPAGILSISVAIVPVLTFLIAALLGLERFEALRLTGLALGIVAILLLVGPENSLPDTRAMYWVLVVFAASASYAALGILLALWNPPGSRPLTSTCGMFIFGGLIMLPLVFGTGTFAPFGWPWGAVEWSMFGLGAVNATAYALYFFLVEKAGPVFTSQTANLVTLFGVAWGMVLFGEHHSVWVWLSFATMMVALALVRPRQSAARHQPPITTLPVRPTSTARPASRLSTRSPARSASFFGSRRTRVRLVPSSRPMRGNMPGIAADRI